MTLTTICILNNLYVYIYKSIQNQYHAGTCYYYIMLYSIKMIDGGPHKVLRS